MICANHKPNTFAYAAEANDEEQQTYDCYDQGTFVHRVGKAYTDSVDLS